MVVILNENIKTVGVIKFGYMLEILENGIKQYHIFLLQLTTIVNFFLQKKKETLSYKKDSFLQKRKKTFSYKKEKDSFLQKRKDRFYKLL